MGEAQSKECADGKETDNLSEEDAESDINILRRLAENEGSNAMTQYINERLNRWKTEEVKFGITGRAATGKSTFINAMRNLKPGDDGFAMTGSGDTTITPTLYRHPKNDHIAFYDLPGYSTTAFKKEDYISDMKISDYNFVFIFFDNVLSEDEVWLVGELRKMGKPFSLVRSEIDIDIDNARYDGKDQKMIIPEIKGKIKIALQRNPELQDTNEIFLISIRNLELGEWSDLIAYVEDNMDGWKAQALLFSLGTMTKKVLERKHKMLKKRLVVTCAITAGVAAIPMPGMDVAVNIVLITREVNHYIHVFGVEQERVNTLKDFDRSLLKCRSLCAPNIDITLFVVDKIRSHFSIMLAQSAIDVIIPIVGSIISSVTAAVVTYTFLNDVLQEIYHDAVVIYEHIVKTNADHRM